MNIKKGDTVKIMVGKDNGKSGKILRIDYKKDSVLIEGLNLFKKHKKPTNKNEKGQVISLPRPINSSNVQLICKSCDKPTRLGFRIEGDHQIRFCKKCKVSV